MQNREGCGHYIPRVEKIEMVKRDRQTVFSVYWVKNRERQCAFLEKSQTAVTHF
jgi:hypothetical protein